VLATLAALAIVPLVRATPSPQTTAPNVFVDIHVTLTDSKIILSRHSAPRGTDARFIVKNIGKKAHSFTLGTVARGLGTQTGFDKVFRPNQSQVLLLFLDYRGKLPYYSKLKADKNKPGMKGVFVIGAPIPGSVDG